MRENDLIWFFVVNNYLLGRGPAAFDILYWNSDATRMPATMQSYYLRNMYHRNVLKDAGALMLANVPIDLGRSMFLSIFCRLARIILRRGARPMQVRNWCRDLSALSSARPAT